MKSKILVVNLNPTFQITYNFNSLKIGEVNRTKDYEEIISGKGVNVLRMINELGEEATLLTHLGGKRAEEFIQKAKMENMKILSINSNSKIRTCTTINAGNLTTELVEEPEPVCFDTSSKLLKLFNSLLNTVDIIIFCGTNALGYPSNFTPTLVKLAKQQNKIVILDIKGENLKSSLIYKPDIIKCNLSEFSQTFIDAKEIAEQNKNEKLKEQIKQITQIINQRYDIKTIITRGKYPTFYYLNSFKELKIEKVKAKNTTGCGDAFTAGLIVGLIRNYNLEESIKFANHIAALKATCLKTGSFI